MHPFVHGLLEGIQSSTQVRYTFRDEGLLGIRLSRDVPPWILEAWALDEQVATYFPQLHVPSLGKGLSRTERTLGFQSVGLLGEE